MGLMASSPNPNKTPVVVKRKSGGIDFGNLAPLSSASGSRKPAASREVQYSKERDENAMDSDDEDEDEDEGPHIADEDDEKDMSRTFLTAEEVLEESKLSDELRKTKVSIIQAGFLSVTANRRTAEACALS
jgi:hypothetical protein